MDVESVVPPHITIPVLAVIVLVCLVFMFGFRMTSPQPPSFDFDDESSDKKSRRGRRRVTSKLEKSTTNGSVPSQKESREKAAPVKTTSPTAAANNDSPKKAKPVVPKITTTSTITKPKKSNEKEQEREEEGGEGWITPISKKERKQNKQNAGQKEVTSQAPARLSPRPHKVSASGDSVQSISKAPEQAAGKESTEVDAAKVKQGVIESEKNDNEEKISAKPEEETKADEKMDVKKTPETLSATPPTGVESPSNNTNSKSSRKKKKAAAAAAAVADFASEMPEEPSMVTESTQEVVGDSRVEPVETVVEPVEAGVEPVEAGVGPVEEKMAEEAEAQVEEEFIVTKSKKSRKKKGKNTTSASESPESTTVPESPASEPLATPSAKPENTVNEKQGSPKKSPKKSAKKSAPKVVPMETEESSKPSPASNDIPSEPDTKTVEDRLGAKPISTPEPDISAAQTSSQAPAEEVKEGATGEETGEDWVEAKPVKKKKKVRKDV